MRKGHILYNFHEGPLLFPPSFRCVRAFRKLLISLSVNNLSSFRSIIPSTYTSHPQPSWIPGRIAGAFTDRASLEECYTLRVKANSPEQ